MRAQAGVSLEQPGVRGAVEAVQPGRPERARALDTGAALRRLPPPYREALALFYLERKSYREVSDMLGLPVGTVKSYLYRGRRQLASWLKESIP